MIVGKYALALLLEPSGMGLARFLLEVLDTTRLASLLGIVLLDTLLDYEEIVDLVLRTPCWSPHPVDHRLLEAGRTGFVERVPLNVKESLARSRKRSVPRPSRRNWSAVASPNIHTL